MFGMSMTEILFIAVVALVVLGPEKLPKVAQMIGRGLRELRKATSDVREAMEIEDIRRDIRAQIEDGGLNPAVDPLDDDPYAAARREDDDDLDDTFEPLEGDDDSLLYDDDDDDAERVHAGELPEGTPRWDDSAEEAHLDAEEAAAYHRSSQSVDDYEDDEDAPSADAREDDDDDASDDTLGALAPAGAIAAGGLGAVALGSLHSGARRDVSAHVAAVSLERWHGIAGLGVLIDRQTIPTPPLALLGGVLAVPVQGGPSTPPPPASSTA